MRKKLMIPALLLVALLLTACAPKEEPSVDYPTLGSTTQQPAMQIEQPTDAPSDGGSSALDIPLPEGIDPSAEEDTGADVEYVGAAAQQDTAQTAAEQSYAADNSTPSPFAGASPIPLDPIDMPTPTPRPPITFTYETYTAARLGLTFESVAGYEVDESEADAFILREPVSMQKGNKSVVITLSQAAVSSSYKKNDLKKDLIARLGDLGKVNYRKWEPSHVADRGLLKSPGFYANYRGELMDGTVIRGRIHMALLPGNKVLTLQIEHPADYNDEYVGVHSHIRSTLKTI